MNRYFKHRDGPAGFGADAIYIYFDNVGIHYNVDRLGCATLSTGPYVYSLEEARVAAARGVWIEISQEEADAMCSPPIARPHRRDYPATASEIVW